MRPGANRRDQSGGGGVGISTVRCCFNEVRRESPGSGTLRKVPQRRQMRYLLRALVPDALNAAGRRPLRPLHHWTARTPTARPFPVSRSRGRSRKRRTATGVCRQTAGPSPPGPGSVPREPPIIAAHGVGRGVWCWMPLSCRGRGTRDGVGTIVAIRGILAPDG